jgi:hypothetical protein
VVTAESLAIIAVILMMAGMFLRAKKKAFALLCLPLTGAPLLYLAGRILLRLSWTGAEGSPGALLWVTVAGAIAGGALCTLISRIIPTRKGKTGYLIFVWFFQAAMALAYIINLG